jgi:hypothetical protein
MDLQTGHQVMDSVPPRLKGRLFHIGNCIAMTVSRFGISSASASAPAPAPGGTFGSGWEWMLQLDGYHQDGYLRVSFVILTGGVIDMFGRLCRLFGGCLSFIIVYSFISAVLSWTCYLSSLEGI